MLLEKLIAHSQKAMQWLGYHGVKFEPVNSRQSFEKEGCHVFWSGLALAAENEGVGPFDMEMAAFKSLGGTLRHDVAVTGLLRDGDLINGAHVGDKTNAADAAILASSGLEASKDPRRDWMGGHWGTAKVGGTPMNTGDGHVMVAETGVQS